MLAAKAAIATRVDALGEETNTDLGIEHRAKVESRIRQLEAGALDKISGSAKKSAKFDKYENKSEVVEYKAAADVTIPKRKSEADSDDKFSDQDRQVRSNRHHPVLQILVQLGAIFLDLNNLLTQMLDVQDIFIRNFCSHGDLCCLLHLLLHLFW